MGTGDETTGSTTLSTVICFLLLISTILILLVALYVGLRKYVSGGNGRSISNPWLIPFCDLHFIDFSNTDGSHHMSIQNLKKNLEEKARLQCLARTKQIATVDQLYVLVDKFVVRERIRHDKSDINLLYHMKSHLQHDNLNGFIGISFEKNSHIHIIWTQCFRGSLHDHIFTKERTRGAATNFEGAFLRDILKGMEYLHSSSLEFHGNLTLHNCMLDSHWIVKLSGFGVNRLFVKWKSADLISTDDYTPIIKAEELHYFDPSIKSFWKNYNEKQEKILITPQFGRKCDMYSFGVVLYEIYFKKRFVEQLHDEAKGKDDCVLIDEANDVIASKLPLPLVIPEGIEMHNDLARMLENCFGENRPDISLARKIIDTVLKMSGSLVDLMITNLMAYTQGLHETVKIRTAELQKEQEKGDALLMELLPRSVAENLKRGIRVESTVFKHVTILYSDIVGFTHLSAQSEPMEVVTLLSGMYQRFDLIISQHGGYKMETIGDAYCVASGLPKPAEKDHVKNICMIALHQRESLHRFEIPHRKNEYLKCRWGFNSGEVFSGVIGQRAPRYACFGEAVALASKMESSGEQDKIQMTYNSRQLIEKHFPSFKCAPRGGVSINGYGRRLTYFLLSVCQEEIPAFLEFQKFVDEEILKFEMKKNENFAVAGSLEAPTENNTKHTAVTNKAIYEKKGKETLVEKQDNVDLKNGHLVGNGKDLKNTERAVKNLKRI